MYLVNSGQKTKEWSQNLYNVWLGPGLDPMQAPTSADETEVLSPVPVEWKGIIKLYLDKEQYSSIRTKVFEKDLLEGTLMTNLQKTFVMPIYKELSNVHILPAWK